MNTIKDSIFRQAEALWEIKKEQNKVIERENRARLEILHQERVERVKKFFPDAFSVSYGEELYVNVYDYIFQVYDSHMVISSEGWATEVYFYEEAGALTAFGGVLEKFPNPATIRYYNGTMYNIKTNTIYEHSPTPNINKIVQAFTEYQEPSNIVKVSVEEKEKGGFEIKEVSSSKYHQEFEVEVKEKESE